MSQPRSRPCAIVAAGMQLASASADLRANVPKIERLGRRVKQEHPEIELLVLPELCVTSHSVGERFMSLARKSPLATATMKVRPS